MKGDKKVGIILFVVGLVILVLSLVADIIGLGGSLDFGCNQIAGTIVGIIVTVAGLVLMGKRGS